MSQTRHSQVVYVVDDERRMLGIVSVDKLIRHLDPHHYEARATGPRAFGGA